MKYINIYDKISSAFIVIKLYSGQFKFSPFSPIKRPKPGLGANTTKFSICQT